MNDRIDASNKILTIITSKNPDMLSSWSEPEPRILARKACISSIEIPWFTTLRLYSSTIRWLMSMPTMDFAYGISFCDTKPMLPQAKRTRKNKLLVNQVDWSGVDAPTPHAKSITTVVSWLNSYTLRNALAALHRPSCPFSQSKSPHEKKKSVKRPVRKVEKEIVSNNISLSMVSMDKDLCVNLIVLGES